MILLFEENETEFTSLGLGVLKDASSCVVNEGLNEEFSLEMVYPIDGSNFSKLIEGRLIYCKPNPIDKAQPFRIRSITKPIKGTVTVYADHISYDTVGIPVKAINGKNINDTIDQIIKNCIVPNNFKFINHIESGKTFKTFGPYNLRQLLFDGEESFIEVYNGEVKYDKMIFELFPKRGKDRGAKVVYGKNMTDLSHESNCDNLYNGLYPYYHQEKTSTTTTGEKDFTKAYIVGSKPFMEGWLSFTEGGEPYVPTSESPVQIASQGEYLDKVYAWSINNQRYIEKIYNEQFTIIQGVVEPTWITIDWSKFPVVAAKAAKNGYFKKATDQDWGEKKSVGDIIFEGNITSGGITQNLILYFSEVIPTSGESENEEVSEVVNIELDDPIIPIETNDTKNMKRKRILSVNFASEFEEEPTKEQLKEKALEYIQKNDLGIIKHTTTVSFVDLESTTEKDKYQKFDHIELGDTVEVVYEELGVDVHLRVISYEYDVLSDKYESVELGEKENGFASSSIQEGDGVSSLTNDADYTDTTRVKRLIADTITAEYLEATNARMSQATIRQLETERIVVKGIFEASQFVMDELVAKLLTVDNAKIANELAAGTVKIDGNITARTGNIGGFTIDSNSLSVGEIGKDGGVVVSTGTEGQYSIAGSEKINNWVFIAGSKFGVTKDGTLYALEAKISGSISALDGTIGGFIINSESIHSKDYVVDVTLDDPKPTGKGIYLHKDGYLFIGENFSIDKEGYAIVKDIDITDGTIKIGKLTSKEQKKIKNNSSDNYAFSVDIDGNVHIGRDLYNTGHIFSGNKVGDYYPFEVDPDGSFRSTKGIIANFEIDNNSLTTGDLGQNGSLWLVGGGTSSDNHASIADSPDISGWSITSGSNFGVTKDGKLYAKGASIKGTIEATGGRIDFKKEALGHLIGRTYIDEDGITLESADDYYTTYSTNYTKSLIQANTPKEATSYGGLGFEIEAKSAELGYGWYNRINMSECIPDPKWKGCYQQGILIYTSNDSYRLTDPYYPMTIKENKVELGIGFIEYTSNWPPYYGYHGHENCVWTNQYFRDINGPVPSFITSESIPVGNGVKIHTEKKLVDGKTSWKEYDYSSVFSSKILFAMASVNCENHTNDSYISKPINIKWDGKKIYTRCDWYNDSNKVYINLLIIGI